MKTIARKALRLSTGLSYHLGMGSGHEVYYPLLLYGDRSYLSQDEEQQTIANGKRMLDLYKDVVPQEREEPIARRQTVFDIERVETIH